MQMKQHVLRTLPSVDRCFEAYSQRYHVTIPQSILVDLARETVDAVRQHILESSDDLQSESLLDVCIERLHAAVTSFEHGTFRRVINGTGVVLHTNLGRAPLAEEALQAARDVSVGYSNLEYRLQEGARGSRYDHCERLLCKITGAEAALVVNNNAAAVLLVLSALAAEGEVVISRGELIEIGGGFRIPDVLKQSGAILREVGTTNRTRIDDYATGINENTKALAKVHTSNYRIMGFTESTPRSELVQLARQHNVPVIEDLGSGVLLDTKRFGLAHEPTVAEVVEQGIDIVTFSGDKLLGGPQAGIIVGRKSFIERCRNHPLTRAIRVDKMTLAALQSTLMLYMNGQATTHIPIWRMMSAPLHHIERRAEAIRQDVAERAPQLHAVLRRGVSTIGGGSLPGETLPTCLLSVQHPTRSPQQIATVCRSHNPPLIGRIADDEFLIDVRTIDPVDDDEVVEAIVHAANHHV